MMRPGSDNKKIFKALPLGVIDDDAEKTVESVPGQKCFLGFGFLLAIGNQGRYSIHDERNKVISDLK